ncbi:MAG: hypothetical protein HAW60_02205 [Bdellovibrionales bacterium]|nr:hypothetical protein [Bdellovibrionales bacterium]
MKSLVFFVPVKESFAFLSIRQNLIRIPEVLIRLKEAERIIISMDNQFKGYVDLVSIMQSDWASNHLKVQNKKTSHLSIANNSEHLMILRTKLSLIASYVSQIGLFDRYIKSCSYPEFMMCDSNSYKAIDVSLKKSSVKKMIQSILESNLPKTDLPLSYTVFKRIAGKYKKYQKINSLSFKSCFEQFTLKENLEGFVHLGPGQSMNLNFSELSTNKFTELESISTDPLLSWFWTDVRLPVFATKASIAI